MNISKLSKKKIAQSSVFDQTAQFEEDVKGNIKDKADQLKKACLTARVPLFMSFCVKNDKNETVYLHDGVAPETVRLKLHRDLFPKYLCVINGFDVIPAAHNTPIDIDEDDEDVASKSSSRFRELLTGEDFNEEEKTT